MKKLIVIDGNSLLYRAFYAMRPLTTRDGTPTNAVFGFTTMLLKILEDMPDYIAVAFDTPTPTFRHEEYKEYKAHRKPVPDELIAQAPIVRELIRVFGLPVIEMPGFEADDIIGAMARKAERSGMETIIVTGDQDAFQLVDDHTRVMTTVKGVSDVVYYDAAAVVEKMGVTPELVPDYKGLKGDSSDNIPGVPGIGEKTSVDLIKRFGSVEDILARVDELPDGKIKRSLIENAELARLSKHLATIVTELPEDFDLESYAFSGIDIEAARGMFEKLEFRTLLRRLPEPKNAPVEEAREAVSLGICRIIDSDAELRELIKQLQNAGAFAMHCHSVDSKSIEAEIIGISFSTARSSAAYVRIEDPNNTKFTGTLALDSDFEASLADLRPLIESFEVKKFVHDYKLNYSALALRGIRLAGVEFDTMLGAYIADSSRGSFGLAELSSEILALEVPKQTEPGEPNCGLAEAIWMLKTELESELKSDDMLRLLSEIDIPLAPVLAEMELLGVCVDENQLSALSASLQADIESTERKVYELSGAEFNIASPKQLGAVLFEQMGIAPKKKNKTGYSTGAAVLEELADEHEIAGEILRWRELSKIKSTYADALPKLINPRTKRIHTSLNQTVAATGRLSSSDPNLQNIPVRTELGREIRRAFVAPEGKVLLSADYSQIELRIFAHVADDPGLISAFENGEDIHASTACTIFGCPMDEVTSEMRRRAKTINFAVLYGMADFTLGKELGITTREAKEYIETYFAKFPGVRRYTNETIEKAKALGYVSTLHGRRRYFPDIKSSNYNVRQAAERAAVNSPIQGTAADIIKIAMIQIHEELNSSPDIRMLLQVHDELLFELPQDRVAETAKFVRERMEQAYTMRVPIVVDTKFGANWADMEKIG